MARAKKPAKPKGGSIHRIRSEIQPIQRTTVAEMVADPDRITTGRVYIRDLPERLTQQQQRFVAAYIRNGGNATRAAIDAGYTNNGNITEIATRVRYTPRVAQAINMARQAILDASMIDFAHKRQFLWELAHKCTQTHEEREVDEHTEEDGTVVRTVTIRERMFNPKEAIDAIRELNLMDGDTKPPSQTGGFGSSGMTLEGALLLLKGNAA